MMTILESATKCGIGESWLRLQQLSFLFDSLQQMVAIRRQQR
ncbi:MAG: hypothetical protein P1U77_11675 [Rubripirellula sp.]|nr:hypothetical protein [Rubripirellula sp.]